MVYMNHAKTWINIKYINSSIYIMYNIYMICIILLKGFGWCMPFFPSMAADPKCQPSPCAHIRMGSLFSSPRRLQHLPWSGKYMEDRSWRKTMTITWLPHFYKITFCMKTKRLYKQKNKLKHVLYPKLRMIHICGSLHLRSNIVDEP